MEKSMERVIEESALSFCVECGKCVAACPMVEIFEDFSYEVSPRWIVEKVLLDLDVLEEAGIWFCLTCDICTQICPAGVRYQEFVEGARLLAIERGVTEYGLFCQTCGNYFLPLPTLEHLRKKLGERASGYLTLCPRCRPYYFGERVKETLPGSRRVRTKEMLESTV